MPKLTVGNFLEYVRLSGLVDADKLRETLAALQAANGGEPLEDVQRVADHLIESGLISSWQCEKLFEGRHKGFFLGKYKLLGLLGTGGMSSVYLAEHVLMHSRRAIKVLPENRVYDSSYLERFHREARAAGALEHTNIVRAYDVDNDGKYHYIVMEYVEGRDLQELVAHDGPLPYDEAVDYIRQAADGLSCAHRAGVIHRDIKPANLLLNSQGVVKILDLGLALSSSDQVASLTIAHDEKVLGTADYLAPEQALDSHRVDPRADIYSLGATLYFVLTGHPPFCEGTLAQRLIMHQQDEPPSIKIDRPDVPQTLLDIVAKMMAKKPQDRYQTADDVRDILAMWLETGGELKGAAGVLTTVSGRMAATLAQRPVAPRPMPKNQPARPQAPKQGTPSRDSGGSSSVVRGPRTAEPDQHALPGDTASGGGRPTVKGPGSSKVAKDSSAGKSHVTDSASALKHPTAGGSGKSPSGLTGSNRPSGGSSVTKLPKPDAGDLLSELEDLTKSKATPLPAPELEPTPLKHWAAKDEKNSVIPFALGVFFAVLAVAGVVVAVLIYKYWEHM